LKKVPELPAEIISAAKHANKCGKMFEKNQCFLIEKSVVEYPDTKKHNMSRATAAGNN